MGRVYVTIIAYSEWTDETTPDLLWTHISIEITR